MSKPTPLLLPALVLGAFASAHGEDAATLWARRIQPLFDVQCVKCHGPIEQKSGLELDTPEAVFKGGDSGSVIQPGQPEKSLLYQQLAPDADPHMPPKKQLSPEDRESIREWIVALAKEPLPNKEGRRERVFASVETAVDTILAEAWARGKIQPTPQIDDAVWCRRIYLDLAGRIPTAAEVSSFLAAPAETRRSALVDQLLASKEYAVRMRELWDVILMGRTKRDNQDARRRDNGWWAFLENAFEKNRPWNETVREFLVARPNTPEDRGATWFLYERRNDHQRIAEAVAPVVYGTTIDCAQCHDHPLAREIKQGHYWGLVAAFNRSKNIERSNLVAESAIGGFINFTNLKKESQPALVMLLNGRTVDEARPAGGQKEEDKDDHYVDPKAKARVPKFSRREAFADAATQENPLLARAFVNRTWAVLFGRGIVHPPDEMNARNVPSHPELLDWLADDFAKHGYDVRRLLRGLVLSRAYGLAHGEAPQESFAAAIERPLAAEQLARSWRVAVGLAPEDDALRRAVVAAIPDVMPRAYNATFQQAQFLTNSPVVADLLKPSNEGTLQRLAQAHDANARVRDAFLAVYGRLPDAAETAQAASFLNARSNRPLEATRDLLWALMTSAEFMTMP